MRGSGKTVLCVNLLLTAWKNVYDEIHIISPTFQHQYSTGQAWSKLSSEGITVYEQANTDLLQSLMNRASSEKTLCVIFDDNGSDLRNTKICEERILNKFISNSRHCNMSCIFLLQRTSQCLPIVRSQVDTWCVFGTSSYAEKDLLYRQVSVIPRKSFFTMMMNATEQPYSFLICEMSRGIMTYYLQDFKTKAY